MWPTPDGGILLSGGFTNVFGVRRPGVAKLNADGLLTPLFADYPFLATRILDARLDGRLALESATNRFVRAFPFGRQKNTSIQILGSDGTLIGSYAGTNRTLGVGLIPNGGFLRANARGQLPGKSGEYWYNFTQHHDDGIIVTNYESKLRFADDYFTTDTPAVNFSFRSNGAFDVSGNIALVPNGYTDFGAVVRLDENRQLDLFFDSRFSFRDIFFYQTVIRTWPLEGGQLMVPAHLELTSKTLRLDWYAWTMPGSWMSRFSWQFPPQFSPAMHMPIPSL